MTDSILQEVLAEFIEKGAALEHERWARWQNYMFSKCLPYKDGAVIIPQELAARWFRQIDTPYAELAEEEKESDRKETRNYLPLLTSAVHRTREATVAEAISVVPEEASNLTTFEPLIRGWNLCRAATLQALEALKEKK